MRPSPALFVLAALLATGGPALGDTASTCAECPLPLAQDLPIEVVRHQRPRNSLA